MIETTVYRGYGLAVTSSEGVGIYWGGWLGQNHVCDAETVEDAKKAIDEWLEAK